MSSEAHVDVYTKNLNSFLIEFHNKRIKIVKKIGNGKFSQIYLGIDPEIKKSYTVKQISLENPLRNSTCNNQLNIFKNLKNNNFVIGFFDDINFNHFKFLLLEFCPISLMDYIQNRNGILFGHDEVLRILGQCSGIVEFLHSLDPVVISHDLKVESFLINEAGILKLGNFGWGAREKIEPSKMDHREKCKVENDISIMTSPFYRAPEMFDLYLNYNIDEKSDIWSLGVIFYFVCSFGFPFNPDNKLTILKGEYEKLKLENMFLSELINSILSKIFKILPSTRPSALSISREITNFAEKAGIKIDAPVININLLNEKKGLQKVLSMTNVFLKAGNIFDMIKEQGTKFKEQIQTSKKKPTSVCCEFITGKLAITLNQGYSDPSFPEFISSFLNSKFPANYILINLNNFEDYPIHMFENRVLTYNMDESRSPLLEQILEIITNILKFTAYDSKRIITLNDQQSGYLSIFFISVLLIYSRAVKNFAPFFERLLLSRNDLIITSAHCSFVRYGHYIEILSNNPGFNLISSHLYLRSILFSPVILVNKTKNGIRPFVTVEIDENLIYSSLNDPKTVKLFLSSEKFVEIPLDIYIYGNIRIIFYHVTAKKGGYCQKKLFGFQFHTSFIKPNSVFSINGREIDVYSRKNFAFIQKLKIDLKIESKIESKFLKTDLKKNLMSISSPQIFFNNQNEYNNFLQKIDEISNANFQNLRFNLSENTGNRKEIHRSHIQNTAEEKNKIYDFETAYLKSQNLPPKNKIPSKPLIQLNYDDAGSVVQKDNENIEKFRNEPKKEKCAVFEDFLSGPVEEDPWKLLGDSTSQKTSLTQNIDENKIENQNKISMNTRGTNKIEDLLFIPSTSDTHQTKTPPDFGSLDSLLATQKFSQTTSRVSLEHSRISSEDTISSISNNSRNTPKSPEKPKQPQKSSTPNQIFGDILMQQGFGNVQSSSSYKPSLNEAKKRQEEFIESDPTLKAVNKWTQGKNKNIKLLLSSFETVIWCPEIWKTLSTNDLRDYECVKKAYRKACLIVHPDKLTGSPNEKLAKAIFCELSEAWNIFDSKKGKIY